MRRHMDGIFKAHRSHFYDPCQLFPEPASILHSNDGGCAGTQRSLEAFVAESIRQILLPCFLDRILGASRAAPVGKRNEDVRNGGSA